MSDETKTGETTATLEAAVPAPSDVLYVVQVFTEITTATGLGSGESEKECWADIAQVSAPLRSKRKTVIGLALAQSGLRPGDDQRPLRLRVLDAASAHETEIAPFQPDAEWRIG